MSKSLDPITCPAFIVIKTAMAVNDRPSAVKQLWQTAVTYLRVQPILSQNDPGRRLYNCVETLRNIRAKDATDALDIALQA